MGLVPGRCLVNGGLKWTADLGWESSVGEVSHFKGVLVNAVVWPPTGRAGTSVFPLVWSRYTSWEGGRWINESNKWLNEYKKGIGVAGKGFMEKMLLELGLRGGWDKSLWELEEKQWAGRKEIEKLTLGAGLEFSSLLGWWKCSFQQRLWSRTPKGPANVGCVGWGWLTKDGEGSIHGGGLENGLQG